MTTSNIEIPLDALAKVQETHDRKNAEMKALIEQLECSSPVARPLVKRDDYVMLKEAADVTDQMIADSIELFESHFDNDDQIEWELFFEKLEYLYLLSVIDFDCAAVRKIKKAVRDHRRAGE